MSKSAGFTLIELLIVVTIFAVITAGIIPFTNRYAAERQLVNTVEELLSELQLHQSKATLGVNGNWFGVNIDNNAKTISLYEVTNPNFCLISKNTRVLDDSTCTKETRTFDKSPSALSTMRVEYVVNGGTPQNVDTTIEARFNRGRQGQEIILTTDTVQQHPQLQRIRIIFENGNLKRTIVIDGGNICSGNVLATNPSDCENIIVGGQRLAGGPVTGRIFLVENN